jgi:two-component system, OmpR family, response regulator
LIFRRVAIVEDDAELRRLLSEGLREEEFEVAAFATGTELLAGVERETPDALVVDIGLPDADGRDVCQALRARGLQAPVLFLTARDALPDRISGFHAGGDDYLVKPFALAELLVRIQALLRRAAGTDPFSSTPAGVVLDPARHAVSVGDTTVALTPTEFRVLAALAGRPGGVLRRNELVAAAWPEGGVVHDNTLDAYIARIRRKLRRLGAPEAVETVRGVGYVLK